MERVRLLAVLIALASGAIAACGGDDEEAASGSPVATVDISATDFKFDPANPSVDKTGVVEFRLTNDGESPHALEVEGPDGEVETQEIQPGESATLEADLSESGEFTIYCPVGDHRDRGMEGKVKVAGGGSGSGGDGDEDSGGGGGGGY